VHSSVTFLSVTGDRRGANEKPYIIDGRECVGTSCHYTRTTGADCATISSRLKNLFSQHLSTHCFDNIRVRILRGGLAAISVDYRVERESVRVN